MNKLKQFLLISMVLLLYCQDPGKTSLIDIQGNKYTWRRYGKTVWMTENLRDTLDRSGNPIKYYFPNDDSTLMNTFGLLYDFETACKVCPDGWTLPTNDDWEKLLELNDGYAAQAYKDSHFWEGDVRTNKSLFSGRPAGSGNNGEYDNHFGEKTLFWSATKEDEHFVWTYILELHNDAVRTASQHPTYAFSVRCVKSEN